MHGPRPLSLPIWKVHPLGRYTSSKVHLWEDNSQEGTPPGKVQPPSNVQHSAVISWTATVLILLVDSDRHSHGYVTIIVFNANKIFSSTSQEVFCQSQHPFT